MAVHFASLINLQNGSRRNARRAVIDLAWQRAGALAAQRAVEEAAARARTIDPSLAGARPRT